MVDHPATPKARKDEVFLAAYTNKLSGRPGDTIQFHVSCQSNSNTPIHTRLVRSICADPNPKGPGILEEDASQWFPPTQFQGRHQPIPCGSFAATKESISLPQDESSVVSIDIWVYPTLLQSTLVDRQYIWTWGKDFGLSMNQNGKLQFGSLVFESYALSIRKWYQICLVRNRSDRTIQLKVIMDDRDGRIVCNEIHPYSETNNDNNFAGRFSLATQGTWNGRLEHPRILLKNGQHGDDVWIEWETWQNMAGWVIPAQSQVMDDMDDNRFDLVLHHQPTRGMTGHLWDGTEHCWKHEPSHYGAIYFHEDDGYDFEWEPDLKWKIPDNTPSGIYVLHLTTTTTTTTAIDEESASEDTVVHRESLPIFVCAKKPSAKLCVLVSTFTYVMYGNHGRSDFDEQAFDRIRQEDGYKSSATVYPHNAFQHPSYRQSTYNFHSDGSGIHYASHRRPLFTTRPGYISLPHTSCSGLRHFQADSHLIAFLHFQQQQQQQQRHSNDGATSCPFDYDIITDHELHSEGVSCLQDYETLMTGTHPEYHTLGSLSAINDFRDKCNGNIIYLGGNGFYWRIGASEVPTPPWLSSGQDHKDDDDDDSNSVHLLEIRRAEDGVRTWACEPGEYYHALEEKCTYGGLWRRNGRPPQKLVGIGFSSQGPFQGMPFQRNLSLDPSLHWILEGIPTDQTILGDFGLSGGGAAGFELDRVDRGLDGLEASRFSVPITIVAQSHGQEPDFILVPEEVLTTYSNTSGLTEAEAKRADMIYFRLKRSVPSVGSSSTQSPDDDDAGGSQVFSVGSITFCGSLPHNRFENEIATILCNVLTRFASTD
ncbi:unnamed protein product [Cylindrotheca closterium]|uniref:N,N-dimethylformamidase beta subunit-like C-terminal domain-containing protein n=1 Tax=Cylindrotheca closterium TaxID=2856 RepID=A0AAD2CRM3_9STRA|nr:unnamed protein product [Cylindrotheca closterium]